MLSPIAVRLSRAGDLGMEFDEEAAVESLRLEIGNAEVSDGGGGRLGGEEGDGGARGSEANEEAHDEAEGEMDEDLLP